MRKIMKPSHKRYRGFTLAELLLAAAILAFALTGILLLFTNCMLLNAANRNLSIATSHAQYIMEDIKAAGTGVGSRITVNNGTPAGWDLNASQIQSTYNLFALNNETINTTVFQTGPLGVLVVVNWLDRRLKASSIPLVTLIADY